MGERDVLYWLLLRISELFTLPLIVQPLLVKMSPDLLNRWINGADNTTAVKTFH